MIVDTAYLYASLGILITSFGILAVYGFLLWQKDKQLQHKEKILERKLSNLLTDAEKEAGKIITQATNQANQLIKEAAKLEIKIKDQLDHSTQSMVSTHNAKLGEVFRQLHEQQEEMMKIAGQESEKIATQVLNQFKTEGEKAAKDFASVLQAEVKKSQEGLSKRLGDDYETVKKEIAAYKETQVKRIDEIAKEVIARVTADALSRSISAEEQERLVLDALERSKKENPLIG